MTICLDCGREVTGGYRDYYDHSARCLRSAAPIEERKARLLAELQTIPPLPSGNNVTRYHVLGSVALELLAEEAGAPPRVVHHPITTPST